MILTLIWTVLMIRMINNRRLIRIIVATVLASLLLQGCGKANPESTEAVDSSAEQNSVAKNETDVVTDAESQTEKLSEEGERNTALESPALEMTPDIGTLQSENEDVIGWLRIPGTSIDYPILQSWEEDDYYATRNSDKKPDSKGALYIEMANMANMCDFNTVIHGSTGENGLFSELINFENPDFFEANEEFKIFIEDNELTYEIWAVLERDNSSLIRTYDFSYISGCKDFLEDVYDAKVMGKQIRSGWGDVNEYNFLVTLTADNPESEKQLIVIGALIEDKAGTIDRAVME